MSVPTIVPAYRTRTADPARFELALTRYQHFLQAQQRRTLLALGPSRREVAAIGSRPRWVRLAIDWGITPGLWALAVVLAFWWPPFVALYVLQLVVVLAPRPGAR